MLNFSGNTHIHTSLHPASHTNRRMLYTKFIIPIFTPTLTCPMLRASRLACWANTCSTRARTLDRFRFASLLPFIRGAFAYRLAMSMTAVSGIGPDTSITAVLIQQFFEDLAIVNFSRCDGVLANDLVLPVYADVAFVPIMGFMGVITESGV